MESDFALPEKLSDLVDKKCSEYYTVYEVVPVSDLADKLSGCKDALYSEGFYYILENFDVLYSVLYNMKDVPFEVLHRFYRDILMKSLEIGSRTLEMLFSEDEICPEDRGKALNSIKMIFYLVVQFLKLFQEKIDREYDLVIDKKGKKCGRLQKHIEKHNWDWESNERLAFIHIDTIMKYPLHQLWSPPLVEDDFVNMVADCCYRALEKPAITAAKLRPTKECVFNILGTLIKSYNHVSGFKIKTVHLLKSYEHLASPLANAVVTYVTEMNCPSLVKELILEIVDVGDIVLEGHGQDSSAIKSFSNFIIEIAEKDPELILPCTDFLTPNLSCDPFTMRMCVLTVLSELIVRILKSDQMSEELKKMRDSFLDHLTDHMVDVNVFVRARVLKLWQRIWEENAVPKNKVIPLIEAAISRLNDKSTFVVKNAIQLLRIVLRKNIYGDKLSESHIQEMLVKLQQKLTEVEREEKEASEKNEEIWFQIKSKLTAFLRSKIESVEKRKSLQQCTEEDLLSRLEEIRDHINTHNYEDAFNMVLDVESCFPETYQQMVEMDAADKVEYYCWLFKTIWKGDMNLLKQMPKRSQAEKRIRKLFGDVASDAESQLDADTLKFLITYHKDFLVFVRTLKNAIPIVCELILGVNTQEVSEGIEFFVAAKQFELPGCDEGVRSMLPLVFSKEKQIREAVTGAFRTLYVNEEDKSRVEAIKTVYNLMNLLKHLTYQQKDALEEIVKNLITDNGISRECILVLWEIYSRKFPNTSPDDRRAAICLLSMVAGGKVQIVKNNLDVLVAEGLTGDNRKDYLLVKNTCRIFRKLACLKNEKNVTIRYSAEEPIFANMISFVLEEFKNVSNVLYPEIANEVITALYELSELPDITCENLVKNLYTQLKEEVSTEDGKPPTITEELLARFVFIIGHIAFSECKYLQKDVLEELKRRNKLEITNQQKNHVDNSSVKQKKNRKVSLSSNDGQNAEDMQEEMDVLAESDYRVTETILQACEKEILYGGNLLSAFCPLVVKICQNPGVHCGTRIKSAATIALSKLMMVSPIFCEDNVQLYFTILMKSSDPEVRTNLLLAFGDLTFKYPNIMEPWTYTVYSRLKDSNTEVRYTALLVISYLVLNEMIKVKAQIADVALCIVDKDPKIRHLATQLFNDLGQKVNTIYNVMPDIISRLSNADEKRIPQEDFQFIIKYLMSLITKERHFESLVEKLCHRLRGAEDERQSSDLSYCLTLINYSERALQKLIDNMTCYAEKIQQPEVHKNFIIIITNCKKHAKVAKTQDVIDELEEKINTILTKGVLNDSKDEIGPLRTPSLASRSAVVPMSGTKKLAVASSKSKKKKLDVKGVKSTAKNPSDTEDSAVDDSDEIEVRKEKRPTRTNREPRSRVIETTSEEDEGTPKAKRPAGVVRKPVDLTSSSEE